MALAVAIFAVALVVIATERAHRTKVALLGAGLVVSRRRSTRSAIEAIDFNTMPARGACARDLVVTAAAPARRRPVTT